MVISERVTSNAVSIGVMSTQARSLALLQVDFLFFPLSASCSQEQRTLPVRDQFGVGFSAMQVRSLESSASEPSVTSRTRNTLEVRCCALKLGVVQFLIKSLATIDHSPLT